MLAPVPPPRPASSEITLVDKVTPAVEKTAPVVGVASTPATPRTPVLIEIVHRIEHASDPVVDFASGVTGHLLGLRRKVGL